MIDEKCLHCERLGVSCNGSNFIEMSSSELLEWCKTRKEILDLTNEDISEMSGVPLGTINRLFSGKNPDFRYETVRPITKALISKEWREYECGQLLTERIKQLEEENKKLKESIKNSGKSEDKMQMFDNYIVLGTSLFPWVLLLIILIFSK